MIMLCISALVQIFFILLFFGIMIGLACADSGLSLQGTLLVAFAVSILWVIIYEIIGKFNK